MKYILLVGDGMAGWPHPAFLGKTTLAAAKKPCMDRLAGSGEVGLFRSAPEGFLGAPGSETANLTILGYEAPPGFSRAPLEALGMGISAPSDALILRLNFVSLSEEGFFGNWRMLDFSAGDLSGEEGRILLSEAAPICRRHGLHAVLGMGYRNLAVWRTKKKSLHLTPPQAIGGERIGPYLPEEPVLNAVMQEVGSALSRHPVVAEQRKEGRPPANAVWFWGEGRLADVPLEEFQKKYGRSGAMVAAVDVIKGLGAAMGMAVLTPPGATGGADTDYAAKGKAALAALLSGLDFVMVHVEAPDACAHQGDAFGKKLAVERIDQDLLAPLVSGLEQNGLAFRLLCLPDHYTPLEVRVHTAEPVPYFLYDSRGNMEKSGLPFHEKAARLAGKEVQQRDKLFCHFLEQENAGTK